MSRAGLECYVEVLREKRLFSFSRFGDGEWSAILGRSGANCDGHVYFPELGERLRKAILDPMQYYYAFQSKAMDLDGRAIARFIRHQGVQFAWHDADVFHDANLAGDLFPLIEQLRKMDVVVVGAEHLRHLNEDVFPYVEYIEIPPENCFLEVDSIKEQMLEVARKRSHMVFALSASMTANVLIHDLYPLICRDHWMIDFGSLWDIYVGVKSRGVYRKQDWSSLIRKNLGENQ
ncbi:MAG: DUF1792 domain-containing protein [Deltaproteobacteria bacterium]|nr:DUF1792 domain-containing protein [Deltaproteobacteria bacterium]